MIYSTTNILQNKTGPCISYKLFTDNNDNDSNHHYDPFHHNDI